METEKVASHFTAKIVRSYVRHHTVGAAQLSDLITTVHRALGELGQPYHPEEVRTPAVSVRRSVHQDYVVCLDCGYRGKTLRRHISTRHGLSRDEYLKRWGLRSDHPLTAPSYSERRSTMAKAMGFGCKRTAQATPKVSPPAASQACRRGLSWPGRDRRAAAQRPPGHAPAVGRPAQDAARHGPRRDRKSTRLNSSHSSISYAVFCLKKKNKMMIYILLKIKKKIIKRTK